jgi:hypothetical protein
VLPSAGWPLSGARTLTLWRPSARTPRSPAAHPGLVGVVCAVENERSAGRGVEAAAGGRDAAELHERGLLLRHCHRGACAPRRAQAFGRELRCARAFWCDPSMRSLMRDVRRATCRCAAAARAGPSSHPGAHRARAPCLHPVRPSPACARRRAPQTHALCAARRARSPWMSLAVRAPHPSQRVTLSVLFGLAFGGVAASTSVWRCTKRNSLIKDPE